MPGAVAGYKFLLQRDTGGAFTTIEGQRAAGLSMSREMLDSSSKTGATRWRYGIEGGRAQASGSCSGVYEDNTQINAIRTAFLAGTHNDYRFVDDNGDYYEGEFAITAFNISGDDGDVQTFDFSLESTGPVDFEQV